MAAKYEIIIYWSNEDNAYLAEGPELPGCMADGVKLSKSPAKRGDNNSRMD
jgi:predicted RNase H-like HicB family nuclease